VYRKISRQDRSRSLNATDPLERRANNPIEVDHSQLKHRLRPMRGLQTEQTAQVIIAGRAFVQDLRRGHYELGLDASPGMRIAAAFRDFAKAI
jgi:hypothetical protein